MKRFPLFFVLLFGGFLLIGADGCSSDPNVEGAKLDLRNKDYDRALENLDEALQNNPDNAEAYALRGQVLQEKAFATEDPEQHSQLLDEMQASYDKALELDPVTQDDIKNRLDLAYFNEFQRGIQAFNRGQNADEGDAEFNTAAMYFDNAAMIRPDSASAYVNKGFALINAGRTEDAIQPFETAVERGEESMDIYIYLADLYRQYEQPEKAITLLEGATEKYPDNPDLQAQLLNSYISAGQVDRAMDVYRTAVEREPNNKLYRYNYGSLLLEAEEYEGAVEQLAKAVELDSEYSNAHYNLGAAYINQAVALNEQISAMDDELRENRDSMSEAEVTQKEQEMEQLAEQRRTLFEKAIGPLETAKTLTEGEGGDATGICQALFQAYVQTGQQEKAEGLAECAGYDLMLPDRKQLENSHQNG